MNAFSANYRNSYFAFIESYDAKAVQQDSAKQVEPSGREEGTVPEKWLSDPDLQNLLLVNRTQLNLYQKIATGDAKAASRNSQVAMVIGFLMLVVGAALAIRAPNTTSKIVIGALASIGSILSGYIGQTFLKAQAQAMRQLNYYFRQPLVASYLLSAERIALKLQDDKSTEKALLDVIKNVLLAANHAEVLDSTPHTKPSRTMETEPSATQTTAEDEK
jgi:hypothetical protein